MVPLLSSWNVRRNFSLLLKLQQATGTVRSFNLVSTTSQFLQVKYWADQCMLKA